MQTAEANLRLYSMAQQLGTADRDVIQKEIDNSDNKSLIEEAQDLGKLQASKISGKEAMNVQKYPVHDYVHVPDGIVQRTNAAGEPVWIHPDGSVGTDKTPGSREAIDATYSVIKNDMSDDLWDHTSEKVGANTTVKTPTKLKQTYGDAQFYNIGGPQFANATNLHGKLPIAVGSNLKTQVMGLNMLAAEAESMARVTGKPLTDADGNPISGRDYVRNFVKDNPSLLTSIGKWQHAPGVEPDNKYQSLMNATDPGSQSARTDMAKFFGGEQQFEAYKEAKADQRDAGKINAEVRARSAAEQSDPKYKQELANAKQQGIDESLTATKDRQAIAKNAREAAFDIGGSSPDLKGAAYLNSLPVAARSLVTEIGTGKLGMTRMEYLLARKPEILEAVTRAYPDFDSTKVKNYIDTSKDFASAKTSGEMVAGATALEHLLELKGLNTYESRVPGTKDHQAFQNKLDTVAPELARFYGNTTIPGIESYRKTLGALLNRDSAIQTQAKSMGDRLDNYEQKWKNAAPSPAYMAPMPGISDKAKLARAALDPDYAKTIFRLSAWQKANPTGDANAAKQAAIQQGYTVIQ